jgi:hypothetical protein
LIVVASSRSATLGYYTGTFLSITHDVPPNKPIGKPTFSGKKDLSDWNIGWKSFAVSIAMA